MGTAARTSVLAAFTSGQGYSADGDYSPRGWLINRTRVTRGTAVGYTAWVRRAAAHPEVAAALAPGEMSESFARTICTWTGRLPEDSREDADEILLTAAGTGMGLRDLAGLAGEIYARSRSGKPDEDEDQAFEDRSVRLETTFGGAGVLHGDLTPECASVVTTVLDALSAPAGAEDTRSQAQRFHDGLQEAMRWLDFCIMADVWQHSQTERKPSAHASGCGRAPTPAGTWTYPPRKGPLRRDGDAAGQAGKRGQGRAGPRSGGPDRSGGQAWGRRAAPGFGYTRIYANPDELDHPKAEDPGRGTGLSGTPELNPVEADALRDAARRVLDHGKCGLRCLASPLRW